MRTRGRPKEYDAETALHAAGQVFWRKGYSATSLDDLAEAMTMNRPSIYRAFGSKEAIYRKALAQFREQLAFTFDSTLVAEEDLRKGLIKFYEAALTVYTSGSQPKGCLVMTTAATVATSHPQIQQDLLEVIQDLDAKIEARFRKARRTGQLRGDLDIKARAVVAQSLLHSLSLRARAGQAPRQLKRMIKAGVELVVA